jgi:hypothetical protein
MFHHHLVIANYHFANLIHPPLSTLNLLMMPVSFGWDSWLVLHRKMREQKKTNGSCDKERRSIIGLNEN